MARAFLAAFQKLIYYMICLTCICVQKSLLLLVLFENKRKLKEHSLQRIPPPKPKMLKLLILDLGSQMWIELDCIMSKMRCLHNFGKKNKTLTTRDPFGDIIENPEHAFLAEHVSGAGVGAEMELRGPENRVSGSGTKNTVEREREFA